MSDISLAVDLEKKIINEMLTPKLSKKNADMSPIENNSNEKSSKLVLEIMTKKINEKYKHMSRDQKEIIKKYALYSNENSDVLINHLRYHKKQALKFLEAFKATNDNSILSENIENVKINLMSLNENLIDDNNIIKFLTVTRLIDELKSEE